MDRREFLAGGLFTAAAGLAVEGCTPDTSGLIPILIPEEPFIPGEESWHASTCFECSAGCGTLVRKINGRLIKVEGNPSHPLNRGGLCARGQAVPQAMYHPDRFTTPLILDGERGSGNYREASWDEALDRVASALSNLPRTSEALGFVTEAVTGHRREIVRRFLAARGGGVHFVHEPFSVGTLARAQRAATGSASGFDASIDRAGYVLSVGAELVESHVSPVRFGRGLAEMRRGTPGRRGKLVMASPRLSLTAANADEWLPLRPGDELSFVLAVTAVILNETLYHQAAAARGDGFGAYRDFVVSNVEPGAVAARLSLPLERLVRTARELAAHPPALVIAGGAALRSRQGLALATAVSHLNALLGGFTEGGLLEANRAVPFAPWPELSTEAVSTRALAGASLPQALFVSGANPVYSLPPGFGFEEALSNVKLIVSFSTLPDETSRHADVILPESMSFERFEDNTPDAGSREVAGLSTPLLVRSLYDTRSMPDALIALAKRLGEAEADAFPWASYEEALRQAWSGLDLSWNEAIEKGGYWNETAGDGDGERSGYDYRFEPTPVEGAYASDDESSELALHVYASNALGDGRSAHLPFLQELSDPVTGTRWGSVVEIAASTAESHSIATGDLVEVRSGERSVRAPAFVSPAIHPGAVAIAAGQGHENYGRYAEGRGVNAFSLLPAEADEDGFLMTATGVTLSKVNGNGG